MSTRSRKATKALEEGKTAFHADQAVDKNPYTVGTVSWSAWRLGWDLAKRESSVTH